MVAIRRHVLPGDADCLTSGQKGRALSRPAEMLMREARWRIRADRGRISFDDGKAEEEDPPEEV